MLRDKLSEKEIAMFEALGFNDELNTNISLTPMQLYNFAAIDCFLKIEETINNSAVNSLRNCMKWLNEGGIRNIPDFDELIKL